MMRYLHLAARFYFSSYSGLPRACWERIFLSGINTALGGVSFFLAFYFVKDLHYNVSSAGMLISVYGIGTVLGGIVGGKLADRHSTGVVSASSLVLQGITFFILADLRAFYYLIPGMLLLGFASYGFKASNRAWVLNNCANLPEIKHKAINILYAASNFGLGVAALIIGVLAYIGFQYVFYLSGTILLFSAIYLFCRIRKTVDLTVSENSIMENLKDATQSSAQSNRVVIYFVLLSLFLIGLIVAQRRATYLLYLHDIFPALGIHYLSLLLALNPIIIVLFQAPLVGLFTKYNKMIILGFGGFLMGFGMLMLSFSFVYTTAVLACVIYTIGEMFFFSTVQLVCYQSAKTNKKGQSLGMYQTVYAMSVVVGPTAGGWIYDHLGGDMLWYLSGLIGAACLCLCFFYRRSPSRCSF